MAAVLHLHRFTGDFFFCFGRSPRAPHLNQFCTTAASTPWNTHEQIFHPSTVPSEPALSYYVRDIFRRSPFVCDALQRSTWFIIPQGLEVSIVMSIYIFLCIYKCIIVLILQSTAGIPWFLILENPYLNMILSVNSHWRSNFQRYTGYYVMWRYTNIHL